MNAPLPVGQSLPAPMPALLHLALGQRHGLAVLGADDGVIWFNESFAQLLGRAPDEIMGVRLDALLGWDSAAGGQAAAILRTALAWPVSAEHVMSLCRPDGTRFWSQVELQWLGDQPEALARWGVTLVDLSGRSLNLDELRQMVHSAALPMIVRNEGGMVVECNLPAQALFDVSADALMGTGLDQMPWRVTDGEGIELPEDWLPEVMTLQTGQPVTETTLGIELPDGRRHWVTAATALLMRQPGQPAWVVTTFDDITAQHDRHADLDRQWRRLLSALEGSRISTWEWNLDTGEVHFDDRAAEIVGQTPESMWPPTIDTWRPFIHPDDDATLQEELERHFDGRTEYYEQELRLRHADGDWRWVRDRGRLSSRTPEGKPEWMYGTREDITGRKLAELAAARDHSLLQTLFNLAPIGLELIDLTMSCTLLVNSALSGILGHAAGVLTDATATDRLCSDWLRARARWFDEVIIHDRFGPAEVEVTHADGRRIVLVANGVRVNVASRDHLWLTVQDVTASRAMERQLRSAANEDRLTGLANRASLLRELQVLSDRATASPGQGFAVFFLDFDRFKLVNDTLGHDAGDDLLRGIAQRLRAACERSSQGGQRPPWFAARLGGDEFVILAPAVCNRMQVEPETEILLALLSPPYAIKQQAIHSSASIGIALWQRGDDPEMLLRNADIAMYEAKRLGRRRAVYFDERMHARITRSVQIENALRQAPGAGQLSLAYQPIIDLESGRMAAAEALLRWRHPELGEIAAEEFIPVAEESGQIIEIGEWVLREACRQWALWQRQGPQLAPPIVCVNLSRLQLSFEDRLMAAVGSALRDAGIPPQALQLEIGEREVMRDLPGMRQLLQALRGLGVRLAMDDFGTGASSLGSLRGLPFDAIKIHPSYVEGLCEDPQVMAVAQATVSVIENLGMASVAEGVEDPAAVAALQLLGCSFGQGHVFSHPLSPERLLAFEPLATARG